MNTKQAMKRIISLGIILSTALQSSCARRPNDTIAAGQDENIHSKGQILGANYSFHEQSIPFPGQTFSRLGFDRQVSTPVTMEQANPLQKTLIQKAGLGEAIAVSFVLGKNFLYLGIPGSPFFHAMYQVNGHFNYRPMKNQKGERSQYYEKAQEGSWQDRGFVEFNVQDADPLMVKLAPSLQMIYKIADIHNQVFSIHDTIPGMSDNAKNLLVKSFNLTATDQVRTIIQVGPSLSLSIQKVYPDENAQRFEEIASYQVSLGTLDYSRDDITNRPQGASLNFMTDLESDYEKYQWVKVSPNDNPMVFDSIAYDRSMFAGCLKVAQIASQELVTSISNHLGAEVDDYCFETEFTPTKAIVYGVDEQGNRTILLNMDASYTTPVTLGQSIGASKGDESWQNQSHVVLASKNPSFPESRQALAERAIPRTVFENREFVYSAAVFESSVADPYLGAGNQPYGAQQRVRVDTTEAEDFLTVYKVKDEYDPSNQELAILKFPILERFDLTDTSPDGKKLGYWTKDTRLPWKQRQYMTVDFSSNQAVSMSNHHLGWAGYYGAYKNTTTEVIPEPLAAGQDNPYFFHDAETGFLSFVTRDTMTPVNGWDPVVAKARHGFLPLVESDFEPLELDDFDHHTFAFFYVAKYQQDEFHQDKIDNYKRYAQIFNIKNKQVVYYLNKDYPDDLIEPAKAAVAAWNDAFKKAFPQRQGDIVVLDTVNRKEIGDLRYNIIALFDKRMGNGLAGYGPSLAHPDTGEVLSATSYQYRGPIRSTQLQAQYAFEYYIEGKVPDNILMESFNPTIEGSGTSVVSPNRTLDISQMFQQPVPMAPYLGYEDRFKSYYNLPAEEIAKIADQNIQKTQLEKDQVRTQVIKSFGGLVNTIFRNTPNAELNDRHFKAFELLMTRLGFTTSQQEWDDLKSRPISQGGFALNAHGAASKTAANHKHHAGHYACNYAEELANNFSTTTISQIKKLYPEGLSAEEIAEEKARFIKLVGDSYFFSVLSHEMGHNFGLFHNFKATTDKANFPADYFKNLELGTPAGNAQAALLRSSSIMDYNLSFEAEFYKVQQADNTEASYIGPYDQAAILYGYARQLEKINPAIKSEGNYKKVVQERVSRRTYKQTIQNLWDLGLRDDLAKTAKEQLSLRTYRFCTNGDEPYDSLCNIFDAGTTPEEIVHNAIANYEESYKFNSFSRGSNYFDAYSSWPFERVMRLTGKFLEDYEWGSQLAAYGVSEDRLTELLDGNTVSDLEKASDASFGFIQSVIKTPDYGLSSEFAQNVSTGEYSRETFDIPMGIGKNQYAAAVRENGDLVRYLQRGILFEKATAFMYMFTRTQSARADYSEVTFRASSYFGLPRYREKVISLTNDLLGGWMMTDPMPFTSKVKADGSRVFQYDPAGTDSFSLSLYFHDYVEEYAKIFMAFFANSPGQSGEFETIADIRLPTDGDYERAPEDAIELAAPSANKEPLKVVMAKDGSSVMAALAASAKWLADNQLAETEAKLNKLAVDYQESFNQTLFEEVMTKVATNNEVINRLNQSLMAQGGASQVLPLLPELGDSYDDGNFTFYGAVEAIFLGEVFVATAESQPAWNESINKVLEATNAVVQASQSPDPDAFKSSVKNLLIQLRNALSMDVNGDMMDNAVHQDLVYGVEFASSLLSIKSSTILTSVDFYQMEDIINQNVTNATMQKAFLTNLTNAMMEALSASMGPNLAVASMDSIILAAQKIEDLAEASTDAAATVLKTQANQLYRKLSNSSGTASTEAALDSTTHIEAIDTMVEIMASDSFNALVTDQNSRLELDFMVQYSKKLVSKSVIRSQVSQEFNNAKERYKDSYQKIRDIRKVGEQLSD